MKSSSDAGMVKGVGQKGGPLRRDPAAYCDSGTVQDAVGSYDSTTPMESELAVAQRHVRRRHAARKSAGVSGVGIASKPP